MDQKEEDILNDILNGEETEILTETQNETQPETEPETEPDPEIKSEDGTVVLSESFLDENTEVEDLSVDPELEKALAAFTENSSEDKEKDKKKKEVEKTAEEQAKNSNFIRNISVICLTAVAFAIIGFTSCWMFLKNDLAKLWEYQIAANNKTWKMFDLNNLPQTLMTFDGKDISLEELKFFLLMTQTDKEGALESTKYSLILEKIAKANNIVLDEAGIQEVKQQAEGIKNNLASNKIKMPGISDQRLEELIAVNLILYQQIMDKIMENVSVTVDEAVFAVELENFRAADKYLKYIACGSQEEGDDIRNKILSGEISPDDAIKTYSMYYSEENGIDVIGLSILGLEEDVNAAISALGESEVSEVILYGGSTYLILIPEPDKETEERFRTIYENNQKDQLFDTEYERLKNEAVIVMNDKVYNNFNVDAYLASINGG